MEKKFYKTKDNIPFEEQINFVGEGGEKFFASGVVYSRQAAVLEITKKYSTDKGDIVIPKDSPYWRFYDLPLDAGVAEISEKEYNSLLTTFLNTQTDEKKTTT